MKIYYTEIGDKMLPKIMIISNNKNFHQNLCEYMRNEYEISYYEIDYTEKDFEEPEPVACLCIIESDSFTREIVRVVQNIKNKMKIPILFISGVKTWSQRIEEKVNAIDYGVDEYLALPQSREEILASIKALIRRNPKISNQAEKNNLHILRLLSESRQAFHGEIEIPFTRLEFDIVEYLVSQEGRAVTYKELYEKVWGREYIFDDMNIMGHIHRIRKKLKRNPKTPKFIHNVYGIGYRFENGSFI